MNDEALLGGKVLALSTLSLIATFFPALLDMTLSMAWFFLWAYGLWRGFLGVGVYQFAEKFLRWRRTEAFRRKYNIDRADWKRWARDEQGEDLEF